MFHYKKQIIILFALIFLLLCALKIYNKNDSLHMPTEVKVSLKDQNKKKFDLTDLEQAISYAIFETNREHYYPGECFAEGHKILDIIETNKEIVVYVRAVPGYFGFENGIFTNISGGNIPSRLTFTKNKKGEYLLKNYEIPLDGSEYYPSLKKIFTPKALCALNKMELSELYPQLEAYAKDYLKSINRNALVQCSNVDKKLPDIESVEVSNILSAQYSEYPYWIGTLEKIEDGTRMVYMHLWEADGRGGGRVTYRKKIYNGKIVAEDIIKIEGNKYTLIKDVPKKQ